MAIPLKEDLNGDTTTQGKFKTAIGELWDWVNGKAEKGGDNTQAFKVAGATNSDEAINKGQFDVYADDTGWIDLAPLLVNGWVAYSSTDVCRYRKIGKVVYVQLWIKSGTASTICTLPEDFRPSERFIFASKHHTDCSAEQNNNTLDQNGNIVISEYCSTWTAANFNFIVD